MNGGMISSFFKKPTALLMFKTFGEHNGEVSSFLLTALNIVRGSTRTEGLISEGVYDRTRKNVAAAVENTFCICWFFS